MIAAGPQIRSAVCCRKILREWQQQLPPGHRRACKIAAEHFAVKRIGNGVPERIPERKILWVQLIALQVGGKMNPAQAGIGDLKCKIALELMLHTDVPLACV